MQKDLHILFVEDLPSDHELAEWQLKAANFQFDSLRVDNRSDYLQALESFQPDLIISDYSMPGFDGLQALELALDLHPDIPFIILTGSMNEDTAVDCMKAGASDYVIKEHINRLPFAVREALQKKTDQEEKRLAEQNLLESELKFRSLFQNNHAVMMLIDPESGEIIDVNPAACDFYGYIQEEFLQKNITKINSMSGDEIQVEMGKALAEERNYFIFKHRLANGEIRDVEVYSGPIHHLGKKLLYSIVHDVTAKLKAEQQLRLHAIALNSAANAILITDKLGNIEWINPAYSRLTGYSMAEVIGRNPRILQSGHQDQAYYQHLWQTILAGQVWQGEIINKKKDGYLYFEDETITPLLDEGGNVTHFVAIKEDITQRKEAELLQLRRLEELEGLVKITSVLRVARTVEEALPIFLQETLTLLQLADGAIWLYSQKLNKLSMATMAGWVTNLHDLELSPGEGFVGTVFVKGTTVITKNLVNENINSELISSIPDNCGAIGTPIFSLDEIIGVIMITHPNIREIHHNEIKTIESLASIAGITLQRMSFHEDTLRHLRQLEVQRTIDQTIASIFDLNLTLDLICTKVREQFSAAAVGILLFSPQEMLLQYAAGNGFTTNIYKHTKLPFGSGPGGLAASERRMIIITDLTQSNPPFVRRSLIKEEKVSSYIVVPLVAKGELKGVLELFFKSNSIFDNGWQEFLQSLAFQSAIAIDNLQLFDNLQRTNLDLIQAYDATIEGWSRAMDLRDEETENHTLRVTELTMRLAVAMGVQDNEINHMRRGALLHDIGKIGVPDHVLHKPGPLSEEEWVIMRKHPVFAYEMIASIDYLKPALDIPYCHHEKWDGTGYPRGLKGEQIPLAGRIFAVIDVWDALCSDRPYRKAWPEEKVIDYIRSQSGTHFDPKIVPVFLEIIKEA